MRLKPSNEKRHAVVGIMYGSYLWRCSLAVPELAWWVYGFRGSMSRKTRRLNRQCFWFKSVSEDGATVRVRHNKLLSCL